MKEGENRGIVPRPFQQYSEMKEEEGEGKKGKIYARGGKKGRRGASSSVVKLFLTYSLFILRFSRVRKP